MRTWQPLIRSFEIAHAYTTSKLHLPSATAASSLLPPPKIFIAEVMVTPQAASTAMTICSSFHSEIWVGFSQQLTFTSPWASAADCIERDASEGWSLGGGCPLGWCPPGETVMAEKAPRAVVDVTPRARRGAHTPSVLLSSTYAWHYVAEKHVPAA